jgi:Histone-binding protein RBBP4 or subunit C of CAF1 complex
MAALIMLYLQQREEVQGKYQRQQLILGTHTSEGEQNYLMRAEVQLPLAESEAEAGTYDEERGEVCNCSQPLHPRAVPLMTIRVLTQGLARSNSGMVVSENGSVAEWR